MEPQVPSQTAVGKIEDNKPAQIIGKRKMRFAQSDRGQRRAVQGEAGTQLAVTAVVETYADPPRESAGRRDPRAGKDRLHRLRLDSAKRVGIGILPSGCHLQMEKVFWNRHGGVSFLLRQQAFTNQQLGGRPFRSDPAREGQTQIGRRLFQAVSHGQGGQRELPHPPGLRQLRQAMGALHQLRLAQEQRAVPRAARYLHGAAGQVGGAPERLKALGDGVYRSGFDPQIRAAFAAARSFVTPYAASGLDEYFAECVRAYADVLNDVDSPSPNATRERLRACDPAMHAIVAEIFGD